jgi:major membrane immunogen (membrane-anchored lipoprotein)
MHYLFKCKSLLLACVILQACSTADKADMNKANEDKVTSSTTDQTKKKGIVLLDDNGKLGDLFKSGGDEIGSVNKYLWQASIEVLSFLPINSADPFSGIIVFGKGKAPGSSQSYDATVYISDPALDARSLNITVRSSNGTVSSEAKREIESAILSRARQLRLKELDL